RGGIAQGISDPSGSYAALAIHNVQDALFAGIVATNHPLAYDQVGDGLGDSDVVAFNSMLEDAIDISGTLESSALFSHQFFYPVTATVVQIGCMNGWFGSSHLYTEGSEFVAVVKFVM